MSGHLSHSAESLRNGDSSSDTRSSRDWERSRERERRDSSRSPLRHSSTSSTHHQKSGDNYESSNHQHHQHHYSKQQEVKVKEERREAEQSKEEGSPERNSSASSKSSEPPPQNPPPPSSSGLAPQDLPPPPPQDYHSHLSRSGLVLPGLEAARSGLQPPPHFWNPLPPSERSSASSYLHHQRMDPLEQQQLMQKYAALSMPGLISPEQRYHREAELARHLSSSEAAVERQLQAERQAAAAAYKLPPPPLRPNDPPYGAPGGLFNPFLNSLCYPPRTAKPGSPGVGGVVGNGIPPPLIPCGGQQGGSPPGGTPSPLHLKLGGATTPSSAAESSAGRDNRGSATEIESQSR